MKGLLLALLVAMPAHAAPLDSFRDCADCPEMVELPVGDFVMGAPPDEYQRDMNSGKGEPQAAVRMDIDMRPHRVTVDIPFAMARNEVTFDEYMACVQQGACHRSPNAKVVGVGTRKQIERALSDPRFSHKAFERVIARKYRMNWLALGGDSPVIDVTFDGAQEYVRWLNQTLGADAYRLPTEAEWEYAARAGTTTPFAQGIEPNGDQVNISGARTEEFRGEPQPQLRTLGYPMPVDEMDAANPWGLRHMSGNVSEITLSCYAFQPEKPPVWSRTSNWLAKGVRQSCTRVARGGSYGEPLYLAQVNWRWPFFEDEANMIVGFRIIKELD